LIETDKQRRWWFATHPEFSRHRTRQRERNHRLEEDWKLFQQALERDRMGLEPDPHTLLDLFPYRRFITAPVQAFRNLFTGMAGHTILNVARRGEAGGPGKWVEVARRGGPSLEHQSRMSGQPIRETGGKYSIRECDVNGVKFDDGFIHLAKTRNQRFSTRLKYYSSVLNNMRELDCITVHIFNQVNDYYLDSPVEL